MVAFSELIQFFMAIKHIAKATLSNALYGHGKHLLHDGNRLVRTVVKPLVFCLLKRGERERMREREREREVWSVII